MTSVNKKTFSILLTFLLLSSCLFDKTEGPDLLIPVKLEPEDYVCVSIFTTVGEMVLKLDSINAPKTTANFLSYVDESFYNGTIFHRIIKDFMIQGGGFDVNNRKKKTKASIKNEAFNGLVNNKGTIAMARTSEPHSATSQFFINSKDNSFLNFKGSSSSSEWGYTVFGELVSGENILDSIGRVSTDRTDAPLTQIVIDSVRVVRCEG